MVSSAASAGASCAHCVCVNVAKPATSSGSGSACGVRGASASECCARLRKGTRREISGQRARQRFLDDVHHAALLRNGGNQLAVRTQREGEAVQVAGVLVVARVQILCPSVARAYSRASPRAPRRPLTMLRLASARLVRRGYATAVAPKLDWSELASRVNSDEAKREVAALKKTLEDMKEQLATAAKARAGVAAAAAAAAAEHARPPAGQRAERSPRERLWLRAWASGSRRAARTRRRAPAALRAGGLAQLPRTAVGVAARAVAGARQRLFAPPRP
jgi:hypothetical protein